MDLGPGTLVGGRYVVERRLGSGGVGQVWAGKSVSDGTPVAIKTLLPAASAHRELVARFKREAKFLSRIHSQYVARVIDFLSDEEHGLVLVLELIDGEALSDVLRSGRLSVEQAVDVAWDVLGGVADLHRQQIIHRDLKPGNVILRRSPSGRTHAVIVDFGMSRFAGVDEHGEEVTALTRADIAVGTIEYMAPEQVLNSRGVTGTADIYAVGAMLYRAVAGKHVFDGFDDLAVLARQKMLSDPGPLETGRSDALARGFETIVNRMLCRMPADRYARAEDVLADLAALRSGRLPEPALLSEPAPALRSAPDVSLASEPPLPVSSTPMQPLTLPSEPLQMQPLTRGTQGGPGRVLAWVATALLLLAAAAGVGFGLHRRTRGQDEPSSITAIDEPSAAAEPAPVELEAGAASPPLIAIAPAVDAAVEAAAPPKVALESPKRAPREPQRAEKPKAPEESRVAAVPVDAPSAPEAVKTKEAKPEAPKPKEAKPSAAEPKEPAPVPLDEPE